ncbi:MAG TPA: porin [Polyangiaceae bacterium]|nr:porin [Polyangiaceae bacterium]
MLLKVMMVPWVLAQQSPAPPPPASPPWLRDLAMHVDVYGRLDGHVAFSSDDVSVKNNSSRVGVMAEQTVLGDIKVLGQGEWKMNLGQGDTSYNVTENPDSGFGTFQSKTSQALTTRLGFIGLKLGRYGTLTLGKQWGVYYDVSGWTDLYIVFGTHGSSTFNAGTDGGQTGEGRANEALAYRVALGPLRLGIQAQFEGAKPGAVDTVSASAIYQLTKGLRAGVAYSHAFLNLGSTLVGYDGGDGQALTGGLVFDDAGWKFALVDTWTHNHEAVSTASASVVYDTLGAELFASRRFGELLMLVAGFDYAIPRQLDARFVNPNYGTRDVLGSVRWLLDRKAASFVYLEGRTGATRDASGSRAEDVVMLGIRFNYSLRRGLGLDPIPEWRSNP